MDGLVSQVGTRRQPRSTNPRLRVLFVSGNPADALPSSPHVHTQPANLRGRFAFLMEGTMASTMQETPKKKSTTTAKRTRKPTTDGMHIPTHDEIEHRARELYEQSGFRSGRDVEFWLEAERQLREELNS